MASKFLNDVVMDIYNRIGIDKPTNHDDIVKFITEDVEAAADEDFTSADVEIGFRRFLEKDYES
jgi:hypothetical protein